MNGYIYLIENKINGKKYVGQTSRSLEERWKEHCTEYLKREFEKRPLYDAIKKYGLENFSISLLEEVELPNLCEREIYWINFYNTYYGEGYNATLGGDGRSFVNEEKIIEIYNIFQNKKEVQRLLGYDCKTIKKVLDKNNIKIKQNELINQEKLGKKISAYSLNGELIKSFPSQISAGKWIIEIGKTKIKDLKKLSYVIGRAAKGLDNRKKAYGFIWKFD